MTQPVIAAPTDDCGCKDIFVAASTAAAEKYATDISNAAIATNFADFESIEKYMNNAAAIRAQYTLQTEKNMEDYSLCLYNCNK